MNRRDFLHITGTASLISTGIISSGTLMAASPFPVFDSFDELLNHLIQLNDEQVPKIRQLQNLDVNSKYFGGVHDISNLRRFEKRIDPALIEPMMLAAKYLLKIQHEDGTIDLLSTNFHSTPDTAFVVEPIWLIYQLIKHDESQTSLLSLLKDFMLKAHSVSFGQIIC